jgi:hypothetical protein
MRTALLCMLASLGANAAGFPPCDTQHAPRQIWQDGDGGLWYCEIGTGWSAIQTAGGGVVGISVDAGVVTGLVFKSTFNGAGSAADGGANFDCSANPAQSSPCVANYSQPLELGGYDPNPSSSNASVYLGALEDKDGGYIVSILNNYGSRGGGGEKHIADFGWQGNEELFGNLYIGQGNVGGRIISGTGAGYFMSLGPLTLWNNSGSGDAVNVFTGTGGGTTQIFDVQSDGTLKCYSAKTCGTLTLSGGTATHAVRSGASCTCNNVSTATVCKPSVSGTTLTVTSGAGTDTVSYLCL